jgi:ATP synthase mitochondrial F1 complex assembly factor 2
MTRFWDTVGIERRGDLLTVTLDKRPLKTPSGNTLFLPSKKSLLASLIATEWDHQATILKPHALPIVGLSRYC